MKKKIILFLLVLVSNCFSQYVPQFLTQPPVGYQINLGHNNAKGLVGIWLFNEGSGTKVYDLSGNGKDGTFANMNEANWVSGRDGYALDFTGDSDEAVQIAPSDNSTVNQDKISIAAWVNVSVFDDFGPIYEEAYTGGTSRFIFGFRSTGAVLLAGRSSNSGSLQQWTTTLTLSTGIWYHICAVIDVPADNVDIYVDGVLRGLAGTGNWADAAFDATIPTTVDMGVNGGFLAEDFEGFLGSLMVWNNRLLTKEDVTNLFVNQYAMFGQPPGRMLAAVAVAAATVDRRRLINNK